MGLRLTVLAALGVGVLAAPCGGIKPSSFLKGDKVEMLGKAAEVTGEVIEEEQECQKLNVEPAVAEEYALGGTLAIHFVQRGGGLLLEKPSSNGGPRASRRPGEALHDYVNTVGKNLAAQSLRPTLDWTFGVYKDRSQFNALSAPGGYVFLSQRVMLEVENEGQLAGVLAHEISHVVLKHAIRQYNAAKLKTCRLAYTGKIALEHSGIDALKAAVRGDGTLDLDNEPGLLSKLAEGTIELFDDGNDPSLERESDLMAVQLMMSAGYDPRDYLRLLDKLTDDNKQKNHPPKADRKKNIEKHLAGMKAKGDEFPGLALEGFHSPPLKESALAAIRGSSATGVTKDSAK